MAVSKLFRKIEDGAKYFTKMGNTNTLFRKIENTGRKIDNSVARVGNFLINTSKSLGLPNPVASTIQQGVNLVHNTRTGIKNNLEKAIHAPLSDVRKETYA